MALSRRRFCSIAAAALSSRIALPQSELASSRPDVAAIDQGRILAAADRALREPVETLTQHPSGPAPAGLNDFAAEGEPAADSVAGLGRAGALLHFTLAVPALVAAAILMQSHDEAKAAACTRKAADWLDAWLVTASRMTPTLASARLSAQSHTPLPEGVADAAALAEIARAIPFLASFNGSRPNGSPPGRSGSPSSLSGSIPLDSPAWHATARITPAARGCCCAPRSPFCSRMTQPSRHSATAFAPLRSARRSLPTVSSLTSSRPENPYRNSLFNLDLLAASADLLSTRFESAWNYELQDGPGMRGAIARHAPWIRTRNSWPYKADLHFFTALPCRRPALLFAARALQQADYAAIWRTLNPDPTEPAILRSFPIRQPLLWTARPRPAKI